MKQKGSILILSLWTLIFLSILSVVFGSIARQQILLARNIESRTQLYDLTYSGIMIMLDTMNSERKKDLTPKTDSLSDFWANDPGLFANIRVGNGEASFEYETIDNLTKKEQQRFGAIDEERKINLNFADKYIVKRLLVQTAELDDFDAEKISSAINDWIDADDILYDNEEENVLTESGHYKQLGYDYVPRNKHFSSIEEILLVEGMNPVIFSRIRDHVTVYSDGKVNINTTTTPVLMALGLSLELAGKVISYRAGADMTEGTVDDRVFYPVDAILEDLAGTYSLSDEEILELTDLIGSGVLDTLSKTFNAVCTGKLDVGGPVSKGVCIFQKSGHILYWGWRLQEGVR